MAKHLHNDQPDPFAIVVQPRVAQRMLGGIGTNQLWALLNSGTIESYLDDGGRRRILVASIHAHVARMLAQAKRSSEKAAQ